jgi:hypothetical protein
MIFLGELLNENTHKQITKYMKEILPFLILVFKGMESLFLIILDEAIDEEE